MKEYPQTECTNCSKKSSSWCVCSQCRNNAKIIICLSNMLIVAKKWKPATPVEKHDRKVILQALRYALTGRPKKKGVKLNE